MPPRIPLPAIRLSGLAPMGAIRPMATATNLPAATQKKEELPILETSQAAALLRRQIPNRCGVLAYKKGMTAVFGPNGEHLPCTVLQFDRPQVMTVKTVDVHGYYAVQVGSGVRNARNVTKPMLGHFSKCGVSPKKHVAEFRVREKDGLLEPGTVISPTWFVEGQHVDVWAKCKGKGFQGGMKRHGFSGQPASHGNSLTHRAMGSAGQSQGGGSRVLPGKRMAGRMGGQYVTVQNKEVLKVDEELGIVLVKGAVAGPKGCVVHIQDAIKKPPSPELLAKRESEKTASA